MDREEGVWLVEGLTITQISNDSNAIIWVDRLMVQLFEGMSDGQFNCSQYRRCDC